MKKYKVANGPEDYKPLSPQELSEAAEFMSISTQWISVKNRLPELDQPVALYRFVSSAYPILNYRVGMLNVGPRRDHDSVVQTYWEIYGNEFEDLEYFTHWMPLPEPPKEIV